MVQVLSSDLIKRDFSGEMDGLEVNSGIMKSGVRGMDTTTLDSLLKKLRCGRMELITR